MMHLCNIYMDDVPSTFTMDTKNFNDVYSICELGSIIMDCLPLSALLALSFTSRAAYSQAHQYLRFKLGMILRPFGITMDDLIRHLRMTNSLVMGSIALKACAPKNHFIGSGHLDIVVPASDFRVLKDWITSTCGYIHIQSYPVRHELFSYIGHHSMQVFGRQIDGRRRTINLFGVRTQDDPYKLLFYSSNTALMNAITGRGLFTPYRSLLNQGKAAHNHVDNILIAGEVPRILRAPSIQATVLNEIGP